MGRISWRYLLLVAVLIAGTCAAEQAVTPKIERVMLFKNGLGYFSAGAVLPPKETSIRLGQLPVPSHGTFWVAYPKNVAVRALYTAMEETRQTVTAGTDMFRVLFFVFTFFTIGVTTNFKKLWEEGIGRLAAVYVVCLFGFIIWIGLLISWLFFHGVKPPVA